MCGFFARSRCGIGEFGDHEGAARVDLMHQVEAVHVGLRHGRELNRGGVVDDDVDAAEPAAVFSIASLTEASSRTLHTSASALPPAFSISLGGGVDRARELRMRRIGLRRDRDVGAVLAARSAIASPMPREAPVMKSVFPCSDMVVQATSAASACSTDCAPETTARSNPPAAGSRFSAKKRAVAIRAACAGL